MKLDFDFIMPVIISFGISVVFCPIVIPFLKKLKFGQFVRDDGPETHLKKAGTPTMGGLIILSSVLITSLIYVTRYGEIIPILFMTLGFGLVGFLDDYIKVVMKRSMGLKATQKIMGQFVITVVFIAYYYFVAEYSSETIIPFLGTVITMPTWLFTVFLFVVVLGTVNGVNFTDGLDGLASGVTVIIATFFTIASIALGKGQLTPITLAVVGSLLGFLLFNVYPARVFMGDTGSLALGGFVASTAVILGIPLFILIVGLIYLAEVISVILQVGFFKLTQGKRIFRMAPIHHHFELGGTSETQVVVAFCIITAVLCMIGLAAL